MIDNKLYSAVEAEGFAMKTFHAAHLEEIRHDFEKLVEQGLLEEEFYKNNLTNFNYDYESILNKAKSVIVIAVPQKGSIAEFVYKGKKINAAIPPIYLPSNIRSKLTNILDCTLVEGGYHYSRPMLPLKLLAVRSGLGQYGRNNICYVPKIGSFLRLHAYITDYEFADDSWGAVKVMESCKNCTACIESCPTKAIEEERFLIKAQNCITNLNEFLTPIPKWVSPSWHNAIIGCMKCQQACPHNKHNLEAVEQRICFNEEETEQLLRAVAMEELQASVRDKLIHSGMDSFYNVLPRNLQLLIGEQEYKQV